MGGGGAGQQVASRTGEQEALGTRLPGEKEAPTTSCAPEPRRKASRRTNPPADWPSFPCNSATWPLEVSVPVFENKAQKEAPQQ